jgi:hypothetical protein
MPNVHERGKAPGVGLVVVIIGLIGHYYLYKSVLNTYDKSELGPPNIVKLSQIQQGR